MLLFCLRYQAITSIRTWYNIYLFIYHAKQNQLKKRGSAKEEVKNKQKFLII